MSELLSAFKEGLETLGGDLSFAARLDLSRARLRFLGGEEDRELAAKLEEQAKKFGVMAVEGPSEELSAGVENLLKVADKYPHLVRPLVGSFVDGIQERAFEEVGRSGQAVLEGVKHDRDLYVLRSRVLIACILPTLRSLEDSRRPDLSFVESDIRRAIGKF